MPSNDARAACALLFALSGFAACASGEKQLAEIEGHGTIISRRLQQELDDFEHDRTTGTLSEKVAKWTRLREGLEKFRSSLARKSLSNSAVAKLRPLSASSGFANSSDALKLLDLVYEGHSMHPFWRVRDYHGAEKEAAAVSGEPSKAIIYGEVQPSTFMQLLNHVGARPGQKYYDLGSGTGKTVFAAWLLGLDATGVELVQKRWSASCQAVITAKRLGFRKQAEGPGAKLIHGSFLDTDFSDADVVFIDSVMFSRDMMLGVAKIARRMKSGAKIVSSSVLPGEDFKLEEKVSGPTSWNTGTAWYIQTVISDVSETEANNTIADPDATVQQAASPEEVKPAASLLRNEPSANASPGLTSLHEGPILGAIVSDTATGHTGTQTCSLPEGTPTGMAAAMLGAGPGKKLLRVFGSK